MGDRETRVTLNELFRSRYAEIREKTTRVRKGEKRVCTLTSTAIMNQAYENIAAREGQGVRRDRGHFLGFVVRAVRNVIRDHLRRKRAQKRLADDDQKLKLVRLHSAAGPLRETLIDLEEALARLAKTHPRRADVARLRVIKDLSHQEIGEKLSISRSLAEKEWAAGRKQLQGFLQSYNEAR